MQTPPDVLAAFQIARAARANAHAPYSKFKVGAALKLKNQAVAVPGCNVENASYGATVCAERTAVQTAVTQFGRVEPEFLVVVTGGRVASPPCALCLQVLAEFARDDMPVYLAGDEGVRSVITFGELLPRAFRVFEADRT